MVDYRASLVERVRAGRAVAIIGAGASKAITTGASSADWLGLVRAGVETVARTLPVSQNWAAIQELALEDALTATSSDDLIAVASVVSSKLKGSSTQAFSNWLSETIGELRVVNDGLPKAVEALQIPILTTNYDTLFEQALGRATTDWTDPEGMRQAFLQDKNSVAHLHGVWHQPDTVIFSQSDYDRILSDKSAQFVQLAQYSTKSFIYIGYGSGLDDPNFAKLLEEHASIFPNSREHHFRLCLDSQVNELASYHRDSDIKVVSYGSNHEDLAPFLQALALEAFPAGADELVSNRDNVAFARESIIEQIRTDGAISAGQGEDAFHDLDDLTVAPVLLPMSHEQFASMQTVDNDKRPERLDPHVLVEGAKVLVVVGEEHSGLTTALRWLVAKAALASNGVAPIYVDIRRAKSPTHPLGQLLKKEAQNLRLIDRQNDRIPPHALAVDNVVFREDRSYDRLIEDLRAAETDLLVVGCRLGDEQNIISSLEGHRLPIEVAHIGKLSRPEIDALAGLIAPDSAVGMCDSVLEIAQREHLPRNPFTISLLIVLVYQLGRRNEAYNSETGVLDEYVKLLLSKGTFVDGRITLTAQNRENIIAGIAKLFVRRRKGSLSSSDVIKQMEDSFAELAWKEDALTWLDSFKNARVLRRVDGMVQFQQSSYLHLFAAKAAMADDEFRDELFAHPLYFAPIIRHYAALLGNSRYAVEHVSRLLDEWQQHTAGGRVFGKIERRVAPTVPEAVGDGEPGDNMVEPEHTEDEERQADVAGPGSDNDYDVSDDTDMVPFPLTDQSNLSPANLLVNSVDLASRVVRDSDELQDRELKIDVLAKCLISWGALIDTAETEEVFKPAVNALMDHLVHDHGISEKKTTRLAERMNLYLPSFFVLSGMNATLASRKLLISFESLMENELFRKHEFGPVAAAMFAFLLADRGWSGILPTLAETHGDRWVVTGFTASLARMAYLNQPLAPEDESRVLDFLMACETRRYAFESNSHKRGHLAHFEQSMVKQRRLNRSRMLDPGKTVATRLLGM